MTLPWVSRGGTSGPEPGDERARTGDPRRGSLLALERHAGMFEASGMSVVRDGGAEIVLTDGSVTFALAYRLQSKLLAQIHHLRVRMDVAATSRRSTPAYRIDLQATGFVRVHRNLVASGPGNAEGGRIAGRLLDSGAVDKLAERVDLEDLSVAWLPEASAWRVIVEPYPGSHVRTVFPAMSHTVRFKEDEVFAIGSFIAGVHEVLGG